VQEFLHLFEEKRPLVHPEVLLGEDEGRAHVFMEPLEKFVLELREFRLEEEVLVLVGLFVQGNDDEGSPFIDIVAFDLPVFRRDLCLDEGSVLSKVVLGEGASVPLSRQEIGEREFRWRGLHNVSPTGWLQPPGNTVDIRHFESQWNEPSLAPAGIGA